MKLCLPHILLILRHTSFFFSFLNKFWWHCIDHWLNYVCVCVCVCVCVSQPLKNDVFVMHYFCCHCYFIRISVSHHFPKFHINLLFLEIFTVWIVNCRLYTLSYGYDQVLLVNECGYLWVCLCLGVCVCVRACARECYTTEWSSFLL